MKNAQPSLICRTPYETMLREVEPSPVETGGQMVGIPDPPVVLAAGAGGRNAIREATCFKGDTEADRACLDAARRRFGPKVVITGYYHKHPGNMSSFSGQDLRQARELVGQFGDGKPLLVAIYARPRDDSKLKLFLYAIQSAQGNLEPVRYEIVEDHDKRVLAALTQAPVVPSIRSVEFWTAEDFCFYENAVGRKRIVTDISDLRRGNWQVTPVRAPGERSLRLIAKSNGWMLELRLPVEYPLNPPRVFLQGKWELGNLDVIRRWSSDCRLLDVVREATQVLSCPRCRRRHVFRRLEV